MLRCLLVILLTCLNVLILFPFSSSAAEKANTHDELIDTQQQIAKKSKELKDIESRISNLEKEFTEISSRYEALKKDNQEKKIAYEKAKDSYSRASQNIDLISPEQLSELLMSYKKANTDVKASDDELKRCENDKGFAEAKMSGLQDEKKRKSIEVLELKAEDYENELRKGVWVEGFGECTLSEDKSINECKNLSLEYARRDAIEKGGKALIESVTQVKMFELTQDDIKKTAKVNIVEQDNSGDYGQVKKIVQGEMIKFMVKVRIKVQNVDSYNPYRERIKELKGGKNIELQSTETEKESGKPQEKKEPQVKEETKPVQGDVEPKKETLETENKKKTRTKEETGKYVPLPGF